MKTLILIILIAFVLSSCSKSDDSEITTEEIKINARAVLIFQDEFCVTLQADSLLKMQHGEWSISEGLIDKLVYIEDKKSTTTKFHGLPGEEYLIIWTVSEAKNKAQDSVRVKFKPLNVQIQSDVNVNYSTRKHVWVEGSINGFWKLEGDINNYHSTQLGGTIIPTLEYPSLIINGKENGKYRAIWTIKYGSVSFSDTIEVETGEFTEYEALEDLQLLNKPYLYRVEDGHVTEMNLGGEPIGWIFMEPYLYPSLKALKKLRILDLSGDGIGSFSDSIAVFYKELKVLNLENNYIETLPDNIGLLKKLERFYFFGNHINKLPNGIGGLENLKVLDINSANLTELPESIGNLHHLQYLNIMDSDLNSLPDSFGNLESLGYLHVGSIKDKLPDTFCNLTKLQDFYITTWNANTLSSLPENFGNLKSLKRFKINGYQKIKKLPNSFCELDSLEEVTLMSELDELPENFWNLKSIKYILFVNTNLEKLPSVINTKSPLNFLRIEFDQNTVGNNFNLPSNIHNLTKLEGIFIHSRKMDSIPSNIGRLSNLKHLYLNLCKLDSVPNSIGELSKLETLSLFSNNLKILPKTFQHLSSLKELNISFNDGLQWQLNEIEGWFKSITIYK